MYSAFVIITVIGFVCYAHRYESRVRAGIEQNKPNKWLRAINAWLKRWGA